MSAASPRSYVTSWTLGIVAALTLYVLTWPFVELEFGYDPPQMVPDADDHSIDLHLGPPWINTVYAPLHRLHCAKWRVNPVRGYWRWCMGQHGSHWIDPLRLGHR